MPASVSFSAASSRRHKVTTACENCRRRRAKCSGEYPCSGCERLKLPCLYDPKSRGRRGPKMRPKDVERTRPPNAPRKLAPVAPPGSEQPGVICNKSSTSQPPLNPSHGEGSIHVAPPDQAGRPGNDGWHGVENDAAVAGSDFDNQINDFSDDGDEEGVDGEDDEYCESAGSEPDIQRWRPLLEKLPSRSEQYPKLDAMDVELMAHLLCLFWSHINSEWGPLPAMDDFFAPFGSGQFPMSLLMAVCASSSRFSRHPVAREIGRECELFARDEQSRTTDLCTIGHIQTLCVLAGLAASRSEGSRSWIDLVTAGNLLQMLASSNSEGYASEELHVLHKYVSITQSTQSIGNLSLRTLFQSQLWSASVWANSDTQFHHGTLNYLKLIDLYAQIQDFWSGGAAILSPSPWDPDSSWRTLQREINMFQVRNPRLLCLRPHELFRLLQKDETISIDCLCLWHCCMIQLNRPFFPIPYGSHSRDGRQTTAWYPGAPRLFLDECVHACENSAAIISKLSGQIAIHSKHFVTANTLGYGCFQSGLVFLSQLQCNLHVDEMEVVDNLKLVYALLRFLGNSHRPADDWIQSLDMASNASCNAWPEEVPLKSSFGSFLSRFGSLSEPPLIPLKAMTETRRLPLSPPTDTEIQLQDTEGSPEPVAGGWADCYSNHLQELLSNEVSETPDTTPTRRAERATSSPGWSDPLQFDMQVRLDGRALEAANFLDWSPECSLWPTNNFINGFDANEPVSLSHAGSDGEQTESCQAAEGGCIYTAQENEALQQLLSERFVIDT